MFDAQVPLCDAVKMVSCTPAKQIHEDSIGRLAAGMRADMNLLDENLQVLRTWIGGKLYT